MQREEQAAMSPIVTNTAPIVTRGLETSTARSPDPFSNIKLFLALDIDTSDGISSNEAAGLTILLEGSAADAGKSEAYLS
jgi:hypothetical protein